MKGKVFTLEEINSIIDEYKNTSVGIEALALKYGTGKLKIKELLVKHNIPFKKRGSTNVGSTKSTDANLLYKEKKQPAEGKVFLAICKTTGKEFKDYLNQSGALSEHIYMELGIDDIPNNFFKKKYFLENGKYWHEQYFDLIEVEIKDKRHCKYCDWGTYDIYNKTGCYENHLFDKHNIDIDTFLNAFPEEIKFHNTYILKKKEEEHLSDKDNFVICAICKRKLRVLNKKHLNTHNISVQEYKIKYENSQIASETYKKYSKEAWEKNLKYKEHTFTSAPQKMIAEIIQEHGLNVILNNKKTLNGTELDIYIPDLNLAIEYNGNYWHTEKKGGKSSVFHLNKTKLANLKGIRLIHIFEDEWLLKNDIVISKIKHIIGVNDSIKIGARKCVIKEISETLSIPFYEKFHIQGAVVSEKFINLGAYHNDCLVAVMSFSKKRNMTSNDTNNYDYELIRFATNSEYIVSGIGSKLFNYFVKVYNPTSIISFADRRWSNPDDNFYTKIGFKHEGFTRPNYWYYKARNHSHVRLHKFGFGLNALKKKKMYIEGMSEWECMQYHGWDRIWDCGLIRYVWTKP